MPLTLLFEIWEDVSNNSFLMWPVSEAWDQQRKITNPAAVLRHSFRAASDFAAFQAHYDWQGWGKWAPDPSWTEQFFTAAEVEVQTQYLAVRALT